MNRKGRKTGEERGLLRVCIVYDHIYPTTIGGGERWLHAVAIRLAAQGHRVTYLTLRHWSSEPPELPGVEVLGLAAAGRIYDAEQRRLGPPLRFGLAVARHLARWGGRYDVVHTAAFPYFGLLAAAALRRRHRYRLVVDWFELWSRRYWRQYAGVVAGTAGWSIQTLCVRLEQVPLAISEHTARQLRASGIRRLVTVLPGLYDGTQEPTPSEHPEQLVVFAGRHVREKRVPELVRGFAFARQRYPGLRLELYGDGPDRPRVVETVRELGLQDSVALLGRRSEAEVRRAFARAACLATASAREGYGLVVVEAAAHGTPSVVVRGEENAATELVTEGANGTIADSVAPEEVGEAIRRVVEGGALLRATTVEWFRRNADTLTVERSIEVVLDAYRSS